MGSSVGFGAFARAASRVAVSGWHSVRLRAATAAATSAALALCACWLWMSSTIHDGHIMAATDNATYEAVKRAEARYRDLAVGAEEADVPPATAPEPAMLPSGLSVPDAPSRSVQLAARMRRLLGVVPSSMDGRRTVVVARVWATNREDPRGSRLLSVSQQDLGAPVPAAGNVVPFSATVITLVPTAEADRAVAQIDSIFEHGLPVAVLFAAVVAWLATGSALRPMERIRRRLTAVTERRLDGRVPVPVARELRPLAETMNDTLDRLGSAMMCQRRFIADASHELRSPLASLRTRLEVAVRRPSADWPQVARAALRDAARLEALTDDLLLLAQLGGPAGPDHRPVDLAALAQEQVAERAYLHPAGPVFRCHTHGDAVLAGEPRHLDRMLRNLLDNAARHAASTVLVSVDGARAGVVTMTVTDDGPGIPAIDRERVFERFARLDDARDRDAGGAGLGLAIARDIAVHHGGTLTVDETTVAGTRMLACLPASRRSGDGDVPSPSGASAGPARQ